MVQRSTDLKILLLFIFKKVHTEFIFNIWVNKKQKKLMNKFVLISKTGYTYCNDWNSHTHNRNNNHKKIKIKIKMKIKAMRMKLRMRMRLSLSFVICHSHLYCHSHCHLIVILTDNCFIFCLLLFFLVWYKDELLLVS